MSVLNPFNELPFIYRFYSGCFENRMFYTATFRVQIENDCGSGAESILIAIPFSLIKKMNISEFQNVAISMQLSDAIYHLPFDVYIFFLLA